MESTDLIPLDGDVSRITRRGEEFKDLHEALQRNLQTYLTLTMDAVAGVHHKVKTSHVADASRQMVCFTFFLTVIVSDRISDFGEPEEKIKIVDDLCWDTQIQDVSRRLLVPSSTRCGDCSVIQYQFVCYPS